MSVYRTIGPLGFFFLQQILGQTKRQVGLYSVTQQTVIIYRTPVSADNRKKIREDEKVYLKLRLINSDNAPLDLANEPRCEKTGFLHMRKQRRRSASR